MTIRFPRTGAPIINGNPLRSHRASKIYYVRQIPILRHNSSLDSIAKTLLILVVADVDYVVRTRSQGKTTSFYQCWSDK